MSSAPTSTSKARATPRQPSMAPAARRLRSRPTSPPREDVDEMVARAVAAFGAVHFLFNSAGAAIRRAKFLEIDDALLRQDLRAQCQRHVLRHAGGAAAHDQEQARRDRQLWRAWRASARRGPGSSIHYAAAKGAVVSMTMGVARANSQRKAASAQAVHFSPGPIQTPFQAAAQSSPELVQRFLEDVPMKRFGASLEEIGELVLRSSCAPTPVRS